MCIRDSGSIKLGTDVDVAVMGNDYFDFNSVQLVVASSDTELKTYDIVSRDWSSDVCSSDL